ncbi:hypothetical protein HAX54_001945 [Datura stramonium]|uniref:START domain-containing protein n=1 Tax=Datura stramonium TaxID=4076 RepID=A0ABS8T329_DATST|nr:hypothetical protein [Datura stramonium]
MKFPAGLEVRPTAAEGSDIDEREMSFDRKQQLRIENARLREEIDRISGIAAKYVGKPMLNYLIPSLGPPTRSSLDVGHQLGENVHHNGEFIRLAQTGEPLWIRSSENSTETLLNEEEYARTFPLIWTKVLGLKSEASRRSAVVIMNYVNLVEILRWTCFGNDFEILSTGVVGNYNGALQVLRSTSVSRCRKRPSGCLIQELPNGYSKVTWIEHVEVDDRAVHSIYRPLVDSGLAFWCKKDGSNIRKTM